MSHSIIVKDLTYRIDKDAKPLFKIKELSIQSGEKILIQGPSGKGKTTFLHILGGLLKVENSTVQILNHNLSIVHKSELAQIYKTEISFVFQKLNLVDFLTATENVLLSECSKEQALQLLKKLGLQTGSDKLSYKLSMGEKQRVAVARALAKPSRILLADEPTSSLDDLNAKNVAQLLTADKQKTVLVVSHDSRLEKYFDRVLKFEEFAT